MRAWHFLKADMRSGEGNESPWSIGETRTIEGPIILCERGYHSSPSWWDALQYAPGPMACIVEIPEPEKRNKQDDKQVTNTRTLVDCRNVERELRLYACDAAEDVLPIFEQEYPDDKRPRQAIEVARRYADGKATIEERDAAWAAARAAAWDAAEDAAEAAARAAAEAAAGDAAWDAAGAAAWDARAAAGAAAWDARAAAEAAAGAAAEDARDAAGAAAWDARDAAGDAAWDAAGAKYRDWFNERVEALFVEAQP